MAERVRRLRMVSQAISGSCGVAARPYYEGPPRGRRSRTNAGGSLRDQAERPVRVSNGAVPSAKTAAVERREASVSRTTRAAPRKRGIVDAPFGAPLPRIFSGKKKTGAPVA